MKIYYCRVLVDGFVIPIFFPNIRFPFRRGGVWVTDEGKRWEREGEDDQRRDEYQRKRHESQEMTTLFDRKRRSDANGYASLWREDISKYRLVRSSLQTWDLYVCRLFRILSCVACGADQLKRVVQWKKSGNRQEFFRVTTRTMDKWLLMRCLTDGTDEDTSSGIQSDAESEWLTYTLNVDTKEWVK